MRTNFTFGALSCCLSCDFEMLSIIARRHHLSLCSRVGFAVFDWTEHNHIFISIHSVSPGSSTPANKDGGSYFLFFKLLIVNKVVNTAHHISQLFPGQTNLMCSQAHAFLSY